MAAPVLQMICNSLTAINIPGKMLKNIIQSGMAEKSVSAYPVEVTENMLCCFAEKYTLPLKADVDTISVGDIAEELWTYSKTQELLTEPNDTDYLAQELLEIKNNIKKISH